MGFLGSIWKGVKRIGRGIRSGARFIGKSAAQGMELGKTFLLDPITKIPFVGPIAKFAADKTGVSKVLGSAAGLVNVYNKAIGTKNKGFFNEMREREAKENARMNMKPPKPILDKSLMLDGGKWNNPEYNKKYGKDFY